MNDSLGDRIKRYEAAYSPVLTPRTPVIIRVDGRAFHTYTKGFSRPFDDDLMNAMTAATSCVAEEMQGFKLAYTQSDEATFLLADFDTHATQPWFGYELNKVVSLSASLFTAAFNDWMNHEANVWGLAAFDARAFNVPEDDVPNVFVWRQQDWERNSLQMLARSHFSHKQLHKKGKQDIHDMLHEIGVNWADLNERQKNGTFILKDGSSRSEPAGYTQIREWIGE